MKKMKILVLVVLSFVSISGLLLCGAIYGHRFYQQDQEKQNQVQDVPIPQWQREANAALKKKQQIFQTKINRLLTNHWSMCEKYKIP